MCVTGFNFVTLIVSCEKCDEKFSLMALIPVYTIHPPIVHVFTKFQLYSFHTVQSARPYYVLFSLANEERINFLASSALFPRSFHALSMIISGLSHATNPTATRNMKFACHSIVPRSPRATGKIASRYTLQPIETCLHFILDQYCIRSSHPQCVYLYTCTVVHDFYL